MLFSLRKLAYDNLGARILQDFPNVFFEIVVPPNTGALTLI